MAPFLSFTAEEAQAIFAPGRKTIFTETYHALPGVAGHEALLAKWTSIRTIRADVMKEIESQREAGKVGSSLQAEVDLHLAGERHALVATLGDDLKFVTITSARRCIRRPMRRARRSSSRRPHTRSATAAGTGARMLAATPRIRRSAVAA